MHIFKYNNEQISKLQQFYNFFSAFSCRLFYEIDANKMALVVSFGEKDLLSKKEYIPIDWFELQDYENMLKQKALLIAINNLSADLILFVEPHPTVRDAVKVA